MTALFWRRVGRVLSTVFAGVAVLLAMLLAGVRLVGLHPYAVLSGSMQPTYPTGSLLYVRSVDTATLQKGDAITFLLDENTVVTHRIVDVLPDPEDATVVRFRTQGDANDAPDGAPVHARNVLGQPAFAIPYMGYVATALQSPPGSYMAIGVVAGLVVFLVLPAGRKRTALPQQANQGVTPQGSHI